MDGVTRDARPCTSATATARRRSWPGRPANTDWGHYGVTLPLLARSSVDQVSVECAASGVDLAVLRELAGKDVLLGVIDVGTEDVETPEVVADRIRARAAARAGGAPAAVHRLRPRAAQPRARRAARCGRWPPARRSCARSSRRAAGDGAKLRQNGPVSLTAARDSGRSGGHVHH